MGRSLLVCFLALTPLWLSAQTAELKTQRQKFSYAVGVDLGQSLVRQGVEIDPDSFFLAIKDALDGKEPRLSPAEMQATVEAGRKEMAKQNQARAEENLKTGQAFLAENKKKSGVKELPSGLQYKVVKKGKGKKPAADNTVSVHYRGTLTDGSEFDSSHRRGQPATFKLGSVIKGWQEVLPLMKEGASWQIFVPPQLAYGERGAGAAIGPNQALVFDIELLGIK